MSQNLFFRLLLALAIAYAGSSAQLHSLAHAQHDLAAGGHEPKAPAPLNHASDQCLVIHALDGTAAETGALPVAESGSHHIVLGMDVRGGEAPAAAFQSRAPPLFP